MVREARKIAGTAKALGAQIVHGPMEVPGGDWIFTGVDRQGAFFAAHSKARRPPVTADTSESTTKGTKATGSRTSTKARRSTKAAGSRRSTKARRSTKKVVSRKRR
jgi:hypothetical protein